jgi:hypothetical protein
MKRHSILRLVALSAAASLVLGSISRRSVTAEGPAITAENWGEAVGFKPDLSAVTVPVGTVIDKSNVDKVKELLPPALDLLVRKYALRMKVSNYTPYHPSLAYIKATNENLGKTKVWDVGKEYRKSGWSGYVAGLPFPKPKSGLQVAANFLGAYGGDDADRYYDVTWISAKKGVENTEYWHWMSLRGAHRTDIPPFPSIPSYAKDRLAGASLTFALEPYDKQGFGALYFGSLDPIDLTGHVYVPSMRRILRMAFGTRGDTWNATDFLYEDVGGYLGAAEWMNWKVLERKTMLLPLISGVPLTKDFKAVYDVDHWPHWNPKANWQPRPIYVVEATPKIPDYPYSRMLLLIDAETCAIAYKEAFDKKGQLWKIIFGGANRSPDPNTKPLMPGFALAIDLQAEHATIVSFRKFISNSNLNPNIFTTSTLKKRAH